MKIKIVMKVHMNSDKHRTKALKVAAGTKGVNSVGIEGDQRDKLVVTGDGLDAVKLANSLRNKVGPTHLISLAEIRAN
ncbi:hypothetical protein VNO77_25399 [Canavalia gladiata]|uniref:Uncharacterized protein n=1 Tax=Canavalia gladiata TaxID=3824 RepID=A0AAN9L9E1_CANGL